MYHNSVISFKGFFIPYPGKNIISGKYPSRITCQQTKYIILYRGKFSFFIISPYLSGTLVYVKRACFYNFISGINSGFLPWVKLGKPSEICLYSRCKLKRIERLGYIVIRSIAKPYYFIKVSWLGRKHNYRYMAGLTNFFNHRESIHPRHHYIQYGKWNIFLRFQYGKPGNGIICLSHLIAFTYKVNYHKVCYLFIIINYKNLCFCFHTYTPIFWKYYFFFIYTQVYHF